MLLRLALSACLVLGAGLACNSDDLDQDPTLPSSGAPDTTGTPTTGAIDPTTGDPTTGDPTTGGAESSTGTTGAPTTGEPPPPPQSCRDILMCVGMCALTLDPACFTQCAEGLDPQEAAKAVALGVCIGQGCFESGVCTTDTLMEPACLACVALGVLDLHPDGCEDQADACT